LQQLVEVASWWWVVDRPLRKKEGRLDDRLVCLEAGGALCGRIVLATGWI
jgi:hypothetical protein